MQSKISPKDAFYSQKGHALGISMDSLFLDFVTMEG